jgi:hypothetical protein
MNTGRKLAGVGLLQTAALGFGSYSGPSTFSSATESYDGIVSTGPQTFAGTKKFNDGIILEINTTPAIAPASGVQVYAKSDNKLYVLDSLGNETAVGSGSGGSTLDPTQTITTAGYALSSTALNTQTISYTLQSSDNGRVVVVNSAVAVNVTVPSGLAVGFNCSIVQIGLGMVTLVQSGVTLNSASGLKIRAQHGAVSILCYATDVYNVSGNTTL